MLLGLTEPTKGVVRVLGLDPAREPLAVKRRVGYLPDNVGFYGGMTGRENLRYTAKLNGIPRSEAEARIDELLHEVRLEDAADKRADTYSRGMRQRLGIADALVKQPSVLILDEPTIAIDPSGVEELLALLRRLVQERDLTVLLSSHILGQVQSLCDRVGFFSAGKLVAAGPLAELAGGADRTVRAGGRDRRRPVRDRPRRARRSRASPASMPDEREERLRIVTASSRRGRPGGRGASPRPGSRWSTCGGAAPTSWSSTASTSRRASMAAPADTSRRVELDAQGPARRARAVGRLADDRRQGARRPPRQHPVLRPADRRRVRSRAAADDLPVQRSAATRRSCPACRPCSSPCSCTAPRSSAASPRSTFVALLVPARRHRLRVRRHQQRAQPGHARPAARPAGPPRRRRQRQVRGRDLRHRADARRDGRVRRRARDRAARDHPGRRGARPDRRSGSLSTILYASFWLAFALLISVVLREPGDRGADRVRDVARADPVRAVPAAAGRRDPVPGRRPRPLATTPSRPPQAQQRVPPALAREPLQDITRAVVNPSVTTVLDYGNLGQAIADQEASRPCCRWTSRSWWSGRRSCCWSR